MSILIKMEMPKNCGECPLRSEVILPLRCKGVYGEPPIYTTEELPNEKALMSKRHSVCPLIEVPKHGRLIDADALKNDIKAEADFLDANCGEDEHSFKVGSLSAYGRAIGCVRDAPTIIEAEASHKCYHADGDCIHDNCDTCPKLCEVEDG